MQLLFWITDWPVSYPQETFLGVTGADCVAAQATLQTLSNCLADFFFVKGSRESPVLCEVRTRAACVESGSPHLNI